ncbi:CRISPR-associated endonuclease Cas2 [Corynebacterium pseudodiphtheriticum]|uniref:CRISPR-associated endonuclease Cas2 n=1 Tax=Corynebacterium pseudodiphtheriticum TaxID=37637 RepID=UPI00234D0541|nr:CRISPR-associated endonuclease Cas2 [Corynebacterium pseudodiphtheriticum]MDC7067981.1 CRISPR-associated endonuclease Cas2 [Corynebacterium pseudodiphtheriticum]MDC7083951.1 CRISPR-associated endonuclease Cas2 [Corynebacterium pseudodiphtheriticum]MDC7086498.1 CRISPR-associated endonuclease Cas2 [Corynebacterium pseudodiphtheriticum]MDK4248939.1 CRISPR-associated endonuclease Cas2 [Corynebacterium pseudodiphtheriticum]MDK4287680.1 CRISPR-associated endonuclease Cas2 [Corynebacterium pseudod
MPTKDSEPMWCVVMFDLPVKTKKQTREANRFRNHLLDLGFCRSQLSVYVQYFPLASRIAKTVKEIKTNLPDGGEVRIVSVTDNQWAKAIRFSKHQEAEVEEKPTQLLIF